MPPWASALGSYLGKAQFEGDEEEEDEEAWAGTDRHLGSEGHFRCRALAQHYLTSACQHSP
jgi:hypothetical protein